MDRARWADSADIIGGGSAPLGLALGEVQCSFKKEVKVYEKYEMWTRVLCWDQKWMVAGHVLRGEAGQGESAEDGDEDQSLRRDRVQVRVEEVARHRAAREDAGTL